MLTQVFVALLRTCDSDARKPLVRQALDVLTPALVRQLPPPAPGERYPIWVRYTKKVLVEEGHQMSHLIHIWQLLVRHADMFYSSRYDHCLNTVKLHATDELWSEYCTWQTIDWLLASGDAAYHVAQVAWQLSLSICEAMCHLRLCIVHHMLAADLLTF